MNIFFSFAWVVGLLGLAYSFSVEPATADDFDGETTAQNLNVRTGPSTKYDIVATVPHGTPVSIHEIDDGWAQITASSEHGSVDGWISGKFLEVYEIALPRVASAGVDEALEKTLLPLSQPDSESAADVAKVSDVVPQEDEPKVLPQDVTPEAPAPDVASLEPQESDQPILDKSIADSTDVQTSSASDGSFRESEPAGESAEVESKPLAFEALGISCRRGYFSGSLETCVADIKVDVTVPEKFAGLVSDTLNVKCDVGYAYEADGDMLSETTSDTVQIALDKGQGSAVLESRIEFLFRVEDVTRVEIGDVSCGAASSTGN